MLKTIVIVVLLIAVVVLSLICLGLFAILREAEKLVTPFERKERPPTVWKTTTTTKKVSCPVPFPECGPDGCSKCGGKGFTDIEH